MRFFLASSIGFILYAVDSVNAADFIKLNFLSNSPASKRFIKNFENAAEQINDIITNDIPNVSPAQLNNFCGRKIDGVLNGIGSFQNMLVFVNLINIDGVSGILGQAGPCAFQGGNPRVCSVELDLADVANLERDGDLEDVVVHEFFHCVGIGTSWDNLVRRNIFGQNPVYTGSNGKEGFVDVGGQQGVNVPVENNGRPGSDGGHWRESVFPRELMSSNLRPSTSLSILTVKSLRDLGYAVNENSRFIDQNYRYSGADQSSNSLRGVEKDEHVIFMHNDILNFLPEGTTLVDLQKKPNYSNPFVSLE